MRTVLVVDDDALLTRLVDRLLVVAGFRVRTIDNGEDALELVKASLPDLIILDGLLPGMHGLEILRCLKESGHSNCVPVILLTVLDREEDIVRGFSLGAADYIVKPFKTRELIVRVFRSLKQTQMAVGQHA